MLKCTVHLIGSNLLAAGLNPHVQSPSTMPWWRVSLCWMHSSLLMVPHCGYCCSRQLLMALYRGESAVGIRRLLTDEWLGYPSIPTAWVCMGVTAQRMKPSAKLSPTNRMGRAPLLGCLLYSPNVLVPVPHWLLTHSTYFPLLRLL